MENYEQYIKDCETKIKDKKAALNDIYLKIAEIALVLPEEKKNESIAVSQFIEVAKIDKDLISERKRIDDIISKIEKADEINSLRKSLNNKIKTIEKDKISNYETIGRAAFEAYKDGDLKDDKYIIIFSDIVSILEKIEKTEAELNKLSALAGGSNLFLRTKSKAKVAYLKNSSKNLYSQLKRNYKKSGERICQTELITNLEAESLENAVQPYKENLEGIKKLEQENLQLADENTKIIDDLEKLGANKTPIKTVEMIEKHINELYELRKIKQIEVGELLANNEQDKLCQEKELQSFLFDSKENKRIIEQLNSEINNTMKKIAIDKKNKEIEELNKKIEENNSKIEKINKKTEDLKKEISNNEETIKKLQGDDTEK